MEERRSAADKLAGLDGTDAGALGTAPPPESAPDAAEIDHEENRVPGASFGDRLPTEEKPWMTSLAAESGQAGVANDPADAKEPDHTPPDDERA